MDEQKQNIDYPKVVCFLGAGASVWAGIPTFRDFQKRAEEVYNELPEHSPKKKVFQCVLKDWKTRYKESNIEEYYATIEMHEALELNNINKEDSDCITSDKIVTVICNTIQESINTKMKPPYYFDLKMILQDGSTDLIFITTNWDILFESTLPRFLKEGWINYGDDILAYDTASNQKNPTEVYKILKLHGSLNWGICKNCENRNIYYTEKMYSSSDGLVCPNCKKSNLEPVIVPPTISKLTKANYLQLNSIWSSAYEYLRTCETIYFIGYSFPETDIETKYFISDALKSNTNLKEVIIITDQKYGRYKVEFEERYLSIISKITSKPKFKFEDIGFESFCLQDSVRPFFWKRKQQSII